MIRYAITDRTLYGFDEPARRGALLEQAAQLAQARIDFVQLREKDLPAGELVALAREFLAHLQAHAPTAEIRPRLLINARLDVAVAARAEGVHLTSAPGELQPEQVHRVYAQAGLPRPVVSVSCHTLADVQRVTSLPAGTAPDLILFGPVFEKVIRLSGTTEAGNLLPPELQIKTAKVAEGTGLDLLRQCCVAAGPVPVLALGGITPENTPACLFAGAAGIAAIRLFQLHRAAAGD